MFNKKKHDQLVLDAAGRIDVLTNVAERNPQKRVVTSRVSEVPVLQIDFRAAATIRSATNLYLDTPRILKNIREKYRNSAEASNAAIRLQAAYDKFSSFIHIYANQTGYESKEQIAANIQAIADGHLDLGRS